jgi:hypothetical protein
MLGKEGARIFLTCTVTHLLTEAGGLLWGPSWLCPFVLLVGQGWAGHRGLGLGPPALLPSSRLVLQSCCVWDGLFTVSSVAFDERHADVLHSSPLGHICVCTTAFVVF